VLHYIDKEGGIRGSCEIRTLRSRIAGGMLQRPSSLWADSFTTGRSRDSTISLNKVRVRQVHCQLVMVCQVRYTGQQVRLPGQVYRSACQDARSGIQVSRSGCQVKYTGQQVRLPGQVYRSAGQAARSGIQVSRSEG
jgi:hypothetical protein